MIYMASEGDAVKNELSLLACLEAKGIYDKLEDILPDRLSFISGIQHILWSKTQKYKAFVFRQ